MPGRLQGRTAFITGASSGLGRAISLRFANEGANVFVADLFPAPRTLKTGSTQQDAQDVRDTSTTPTHEHINTTHGPKRSAFATCEVTSESSISSAVQSCVQAFGRVDIVVACAGVAIEATRETLRAHETPVEDWDKELAINARGVFLTCKHGIGQMLKQEPLEGTKERGWVVNLASIMGLVALGSIPSYTASKGAVVQMTKSMALDYAPDRIHVNCICPGCRSIFFVKGWINAHGDAGYKAMIDTMHPLGGMAEDPDVIAKAAVFLASDDAEWVTGIPLPVDGGYLCR
ncbi:short chain dehydrogenase/reductase SDR [Elsinoe ampelina]|uniref:Short chain dehydrogenase/reductase SDR n=1 Tax=Elsinoe ampelina TaxID=302913 RepID=A0A6A6G1E3_9PEZI|nr:short chain dehydrogenase/reductase SDR [Elsinoe ampelina]